MAQTFEQITGPLTRLYHSICRSELFIMMCRGGFLIIAFFVSGVLLAFDARGDELTFTSKTRTTHLIELFTSEGCSSCPPAEAWLGKLKGDERLWQQFVPIAFHVDYWDRLG